MDKQILAIFSELPSCLLRCCVAWEQDAKLSLELFWEAEDEQTEIKT